MSTLRTPHSHKAPKHIDIYTDGCMLFAHRGRKQAAGWGAAIVEYYDKQPPLIWLPNGKCSENIKESIHAEAEAAINALEAVKLRESMRPGNQPMPTITLHTDQSSWKDRIESIELHGPRKNEKLLVKVKELLDEMGAELEYTTHGKKETDRRKTNSYFMQIPHRLATRGAWLQRIERHDGNVIYRDGRSIKIPKDEWEQYVNERFTLENGPQKR